MQLGGHAKILEKKLRQNILLLDHEFSASIFYYSGYEEKFVLE